MALDPDGVAAVQTQALARELDLGRRWRSHPLVNNRPLWDPLGSDGASDRIRVAWQQREQVGVDESVAWRNNGEEALLVLRTEVYRRAEAGPHRAAWREHGALSLEATWRERWSERETSVGWVEAKLVPVGERPGALHAFGEPDAGDLAGAVDWFRIEDHTDPSGQGEVTIYEHLSLWAGSSRHVVHLRHPLGRDGESALERVAQRWWAFAAGGAD